MCLEILLYVNVIYSVTCNDNHVYFNAKMESGDFDLSVKTKNGDLDHPFKMEDDEFFHSVYQICLTMTCTDISPNTRQDHHLVYQH